MAVFNCKMCGGDLEVIDPENGLAQCESCGKKQTLPNEQDERKANQFNRANHYRRSNEFDRAADAYAKMLDTDPGEAEAYWGIVLCRYGIEYVEDKKTMRRVPTCHRTLTRSILQDPDYLQALSCAKPLARLQYEEEAQEIDRLQKEILALASKEEPFDIFISYKETDERSGQRTPDSVLAQEIYTALTREGYKVFFSRITLENRLGQDYEPIIYAALRSAKVMVAVGTRPEYFSAPWVRNEWNRYLGMMEEAQGGKTLIPVYREMDPYDLPEEFSHLQGLNAANIGFLQDLLHGIEKLIRQPAQPAAVAAPAAPSGGANVESLLQRVDFFLEDGRFDSAREYCNRVLDIAPTDWRPYLDLVLCARQQRTAAALAAQESSIHTDENFQKALRFAPKEKKEELIGYAAAAFAAEQSKVEELCAAEQQKEEGLLRELKPLEEQLAQPLAQLREKKQKADELGRQIAEEEKKQQEAAAQKAQHYNVKEALYQKYKQENAKGNVVEGNLFGDLVGSLILAAICFVIGLIAGALFFPLGVIIWVLGGISILFSNVQTYRNRELQTDRKEYQKQGKEAKKALTKEMSSKLKVQSLVKEKNRYDVESNQIYQVNKAPMDQRAALIRQINDYREKVQQSKRSQEENLKLAQKIGIV